MITLKKQTEINDQNQSPLNAKWKDKIEGKKKLDDQSGKKYYYNHGVSLTF